MARSALSLSLFALSLPALVQSICYFPNGRIAPQDTPCRSDTEHATCCGQGYACLSNNICMSTGNELQKGGATEFVRGSCTDESWRSGDCPNFCADPKVANNAGGNGIGKCEGQDDRVFYCIDRAEHDCDTNDNVLFFNEAPTVVTTIGVDPTTSATPTSTTSIETASTITEASTSSGSNTPATDFTATVSGVPTVINTPPPSTASSGAPPASTAKSNTVPIAAGVGAGVGGLALICAGVAFFFWRRARRAKKAAAETKTSYQPHAAAMASYYQDTRKPQAPPQYYEVPAREYRQSRPYELQGSTF